MAESPSSVPDDPRVCPECGTKAGAEQFCATCGRNLGRERRLPTRSEWATRNEDIFPSTVFGSGRLAVALAWAKRKPWIAGGIALGVVGALVLGVVLLFSGGVSPQEMERHVANYYKPESVVCDSRGNDRFYCSLTATYQDGQEHCEGAVLVEYQTWAEDDFIQVAGYGDFSSQTYGCYPREG